MPSLVCTVSVFGLYIGTYAVSLTVTTLSTHDPHFNYEKVKVEKNLSNLMKINWQHVA